MAALNDRAADIYRHCMEVWSGALLTLALQQTYLQHYKFISFIGFYFDSLPKKLFNPVKRNKKPKFDES